ncbi:calmodulin-like protein 7 [Malania oleifera]|uniref:calmodulin-like protein 7 n=1 Tax=Malania oleifera TaxID=397392 RepID=UPI0025AE27EE|nr:calmodulin-like protein 7 [Malania oleifera]
MPAILPGFSSLTQSLLSLLPEKLLALFLLPSNSNSDFNCSPRHSRSSPPPSSSSSSSPPDPIPRRMDPTELKRVFQMFDRNGDGRITKKELNDSLEKLGIFIPDKDLSQMIDKIDVNGDGCVDMDEFGELYMSLMDERDEEEDMREAFNVFDQNGDGFITVDELRSVLSSLGLKQGRTLEDCKKMIMKVDVDGDGRVNFKEFKQMMRGGGFSALS